MSTSVVQFGQSPAGNVGNTIIFPTAPANGNLLIAIAQWWSGHAVQSGWTSVLDQTAAQSGVAVAYKYCGAGESTSQCAFGPSDNDCPNYIWEISGMSGVWLTDNAYINYGVDLTGGTTVTTTPQSITSPDIEDFGIIGGNTAASSPGNSVSITSAVDTIDGTLLHTPGVNTVTSTIAFHNDTTPNNGGTQSYSALWSGAQIKEHFVQIGMNWVPAPPKPPTTPPQRARISQVSAEIATASNPSARETQSFAQVAYAPPSTKDIRETQSSALVAYSAGNNVSAEVTQIAVMAAYFDGQPAVNRQNAWTFVMDGHRFYVLPLGEEGDWAYDTTTQEWCQLQTDGFDGLNFTHGVMWGIRIMGGDSLYPYLYEFDPTQPLDEEWRDITHIVTGGIATRTRSSIGVANFSLTASVSDDGALDQPISLAFSDDNGVTWSKEFSFVLTDSSSQLLIWNALGSFSQPGRVFRITDTAGPIRLDGADCVLTMGSGADSGQEQDGDKH